MVIVVAAVIDARSVYVVFFFVFMFSTFYDFFFVFFVFILKSWIGIHCIISYVYRCRLY